MLGNLDGLSSLIKTNAPVRISSNSTLESIDGFSTLTQVKGSLDINNNPSLKSLNGFKQLTGIAQYPLFGGMWFNGVERLRQINFCPRMLPWCTEH